MIESENHNQNPFIVTLKILSLASKEIPQVPGRLYDLNLAELLVSCLKIIHDSPENTQNATSSSSYGQFLKPNNNSPSKPTSGIGNQSPNTNRQFSTQLVYEILVQICPRTPLQNLTLCVQGRSAEFKNPK